MNSEHKKLYIYLCYALNKQKQRELGFFISPKSILTLLICALSFFGDGKGITSLIYYNNPPLKSYEICGIYIKGYS